ncbi:MULTISPECIES: transcriptional regulator domain-containing protein [Rhodoplanes]|uniref:transcriptional regulator domain-containing protein n=1 Tax=Rhodoplanes TaxID=29407 RepID=UPI001FCF0A38|nr:DUF6499 domain-containing protein [Rhodoplanes serenus]
MRPDTTHWRSSSSYDYVDSLYAPDAAWEALRRNKRYQQDYGQGGNLIADADRLVDLVRQRWGLRFPDRSIACRDRGHRVLGTGGRSRHRHPLLGAAAYVRRG